MAKMRMRQVRAQKVKMKQSTKVIIAAGSSCAVLVIALFIYFNVSNVKETKAQAAPNVMQMQPAISSFAVPQPVYRVGKYNLPGTDQPNAREFKN